MATHFCESFSPNPSFLLSSNNRISHEWKKTKPIIPSRTILRSSESGEEMGLNEIQTLLREAISSENYKEAAILRDLLSQKVARSSDSVPTEEDRKRKNLSWLGLGTAPWLVQRLEALNYVLPTTIQIHSMLSLYAMLSSPPDEESTTLEERIEQEQLQILDADTTTTLSAVISGSTGSGKTLAYLVPMLSSLSESLYQRQRIRTKSEEDVTDVADDLLSRVAVVTSPEIIGKGVKKVSSLGKSEDKDVRYPLALIVVPTRELGVQTAMMLYELVGGNIKRTRDESSGKKNMFRYKGPKGVKIGCILDDEEAKSGLKLQTDVAITTPKYLTKLLQEGDINTNLLRVTVLDEADLSLETISETDLHTLFVMPRDNRRIRLNYLVGASVTESLSSLKFRDFILPDGRTYIATATSYAPLQPTDDGQDVSSDLAIATLPQLRLCLDPGLRHERVVATNNTGLICLSRMLRRELQDYSLKVSSSTDDRTKHIQRPRVVIFFPNEDQAFASLPKLRDAMWGDFKLCALLPNIGTSPLQMMDAFKNNKTDVMLATPNSVRGLDFPALTHVYTLYLPADDPREYVHLAGRVGRIGQLGSVTSQQGGRVTSILRPSEADQMYALAKDLNFTFVDVQFETYDLPKKEQQILDVDDDDADSDTIDWEKTDIDDMRRYLEDKLTLMEDQDEEN